MDSPFFFEGTIYWSKGDEKSHFDWLGRIGCVLDASGRDRQLFLTIDRTAVSSQDLGELEAIYRRYGSDLEQLKELEESVNAQYQ